MSKSPPDPLRGLVILGRVHTPFKTLSQLPIQGTAGDAVGTVALLPAFEEGLCDLEGFNRIWLIYLVEPEGPPELRIVPRLDERARGVFATRSFHRPNPIGLTCVKVLEIHGCTIKVQGVDMMDGVVLLDIKPYVARYDSYPDAWGGWLEHRVPHETAWHERRREP